MAKATPEGPGQMAAAVVAVGPERLVGPGVQTPVQEVPGPRRR